MKVKFFDPGANYKRLKKEVDAAITDVLSRGDLILRDDVEKFEATLAEYVGTKYAVAMNSGTDALYLSLLAWGIGPGHVVLCPSYTFRATVDSAKRTGAEVILYDKDEVPDFNTYPCTVWMPAHIAGFVPEWMEEKIKEARLKNILVIEDAAQAIGAAPVLGHAACYSFYPAKILGCYGDGGAVCTDDWAHADWLRRARNHFKGERGEIGLNSRLDNLQAAILNVKMKHLEDDIVTRLLIANEYNRELPAAVRDQETRGVYQDYIINCDDVTKLRKFLAERGVETMENGYPFADCFKKGPKTEHYEAHSLRIPCNPELTPEQVSWVITCINEYYGV